MDGYENAVDIDDVEQLTVSDVRALEEGEAGSNADSTVIGKVAKEFTGTLRASSMKTTLCGLTARRM